MKQKKYTNTGYSVVEILSALAVLALVAGVVFWVASGLNEPEVLDPVAAAAQAAADSAEAWGTVFQDLQQLAKNPEFFGVFMTQYGLHLAGFALGIVLVTMAASRLSFKRVPAKTGKAEKEVEVSAEAKAERRRKSPGRYPRARLTRKRKPGIKPSPGHLGAPSFT